MTFSYLSRRNSRLSRDDWWEEFINDATDSLNVAHQECELLYFYELLQGINEFDESYL